MTWRMERQAPFLKSVLQEANQHKRQELLRMANADQIDAIIELVMNTLRGTVPRSRHWTKKWIYQGSQITANV